MYTKTVYTVKANDTANLICNKITANIISNKHHNTSQCVDIYKHREKNASLKLLDWLLNVIHVATAWRSTVWL